MTPTYTRENSSGVKLDRIDNIITRTSVIIPYIKTDIMNFKNELNESGNNSKSWQKVSSTFSPDEGMILDTYYYIVGKGWNVKEEEIENEDIKCIRDNLFEIKDIIEEVFDVMHDLKLDSRIIKYDALLPFMRIRYLRGKGYSDTEKDNIKEFLFHTSIKGIFKAHTTGTLSKIQSFIRDNFEYIIKNKMSMRYLYKMDLVDESEQVRLNPTEVQWKTYFENNIEYSNKDQTSMRALLIRDSNQTEWKEDWAEDHIISQNILGFSNGKRKKPESEIIIKLVKLGASYTDAQYIVSHINKRGNMGILSKDLNSKKGDTLPWIWWSSLNEENRKDIRKWNPIVCEAIKEIENQDGKLGIFNWAKVMEKIEKKSLNATESDMCIGHKYFIEDNPDISE